MSDSLQVLTLQAGHRLALTLEVLEKDQRLRGLDFGRSVVSPQEPTVAGGPPVNGAYCLLLELMICRVC